MTSTVSPPIWFQLLATVLSQKSVSDSSPGDSPVKPPEGSAGKSGEYSPLACLGDVLLPTHCALGSSGAVRSQPVVARTGQVYAEQLPKKLEPASEGKVQAWAG